MSQIKTKFLAPNAVTNAKLAQMAAHTFKGNNTASSASPIDLTATQLTAELDIFTSGLQGLTPASGGGTTNFLRADGTWAAPSAGSGTVTSVALAAPAEFSISGSPVTTSGTLTLSWASAAQNAVFAGPSGSSGTPTFRALVASDIPSNLPVLKTTVSTQAISSTSIDWSTGSCFTKTLSANTTFTFTGNISGQTIVVRLTNTASNYTVTWPTVRWVGATAPTMSPGAVSDIYTFVYDGSNFYGSAVQNMS